MNINKENIDDLNAIIRIQISAEDYETKIAEVLQDYRKKAKFDGFRPGKAPLGLVKKIYGKSILVEQVNNLLSENLSTFLQESKLRILGEPLPNEDSPMVDWDTQTEYKFAFDIALAPEFELSLSKKYKIAWYGIKVDEQLINDQIENHARRFGKLEPGDKTQIEDIIKADLTELNEDGSIKDTGIKVNEAMSSPNKIEDEKLRDLFISKSVGDELELNPHEAFKNQTDLAGMLQIQKEDLETVSNKMKFTIADISRFNPAPVDQELFDNIYGKDEVSSEEVFKEKITEELQSHLDRESDYKFSLDARKKLVDKAKIELPNNFLKRWMLATTKDDNLTAEKLELEYPSFEEDLKWQLIKDKITKEQEFKVEEDEVKNQAISVARAQFEQYGMYDAPIEQLERFSQSILTNEEEQRRIVERILEGKVINFVKEAVKLDEKKVSLDEFKELFK